MVSSAPGSHQAHFIVRFSGFNEEIIIIKSPVKPQSKQLCKDKRVRSDDFMAVT